MRLQVGEKCVSVLGEHELIVTTMLFAEQIQHPAGSLWFDSVGDKTQLLCEESSVQPIPGLRFSAEFKKGLPWAPKNLEETMTVRELAARLEKADPEDIVLIDPSSQSLLLLNQRAGMFQPLGEHEAGATLTEPDKEFLRVLRVRF